MYLLSTDEFCDLASRDESRAIFPWLDRVKPGRHELFVSVISLGVVADTVEAEATLTRGHWRRLLSEARRQFAERGCLIDVDPSIVDFWAGLRGLGLNYDDGDQVGDDALLVVATAIARDLTLVARLERYLEEIADRTTLKLVEP